MAYRWDGWDSDNTNRLVRVNKKLALSVCEDMRLPQRSMAYGWDGTVTTTTG
jgi:hypothetical protein